MNKILVFLAVFIVFAVGVYFFYVSYGGVPDVTEAGTVTYNNVERGISFVYPDTYVLEERELGNGEREHHNITLMDREAADNIPQNGEGPPTITIDIFQNDLDNLTAAEWIENDSRSNFKLSSDETPTAITVAGRDALAYGWDGLYPGDSVVLEHNNDAIVMLSVTYLSSEDAIVSVFAGVVSSLVLN